VDPESQSIPFGRRVCLAAGAFLTLLAAAAPVPAETPGLRIDAAKTRVGIAKVILWVSDLHVHADRIEGLYDLRVPLAPHLSDHGRLSFPLTADLDQVLAGGRALLGSGDSYEDGRSHRVDVRFTPPGTITIRVDTGDRVLDFVTGYSLTR
jgi:hypothetical protein